MTNPHIFNPLQYEFEQGQIPSNSESYRTGSLRQGSGYPDGGLQFYPNVGFDSSSVFPHATYTQHQSAVGNPDLPLGGLDHAGLENASRYPETNDSRRNEPRTYDYQNLGHFGSLGLTVDKNKWKNSYNVNPGPYPSGPPPDQYWKEKRPDYPYSHSNFQLGVFPHNLPPSFYQLPPAVEEPVLKNREVKVPNQHVFLELGEKSGTKLPRSREGVEKEGLQRAGATREIIKKHRPHFKASEWNRLLYLIQAIILQNNNGVKWLWEFLNKFEGSYRFRKGRRVFEILGDLGMEEIFEDLILEEERYKNEQKQKQTKFKSLIFKLVRKIE